MIVNTGMTVRRRNVKVPKPKKRTVASVKKIAWKWFSQYIRMRDCLKTTGCTSWGLCITCSKRLHIKLLQAGHFIPGRHNANLFNEKGCHAQCFNCNINLKGNTLIYRRKIVEMYGEGYDEILEKADGLTIKYSVGQLEEMIKEFKAMIKEME